LDFCSLQRIKTRKSTHCGGSTSRYVPPSGFDYPLDGLLLPSPCRVCFAPTALMGFTLRSVPLSKGIRTSPSGSTHMPFFQPVPPSPKRRPVPASRGSWALTLPRVPRGPVARLTHRAAGCSPGFWPFQGILARTLPGSLPASSHALCRPAPGGFRSEAPQGLNRLSHGPAHPQRQAVESGQDNPLRVLAPGRSWTFGRGLRRAMCSLRAAPCITADKPALFERAQRPA
jgi:hypothetical protein